MQRFRTMVKIGGITKLFIGAQLPKNFQMVTLQMNNACAKHLMKK